MPHVELPQAELKVVLIGDTSVGKTSLILRFVEGYYRNEDSASGYSSPPQPRSPTTHASYYSKNMLLLQHTRRVTTKIQIWDTAGQSLFRKMTPMYYKTASAVIVCFDPADKSSFEVAQELVEEVYGFRPVGEIVVALAATKSDLKGGEEETVRPNERVSEVEARQYALSIGAMYIDTSAKKNENVTFVFSKVAEEVLAQREEALNTTIDSIHSKGVNGGGDNWNGGGDIRENNVGNGNGGGVSNPADDSFDNIQYESIHGSEDPLNDATMPTGFCMGPLMECSSSSTSSSCVIS